MQEVKPSLDKQMDCEIAYISVQMDDLNFNKSLLQLNDDCLIAILRLLPTDDLISVACTCTQLRAIAWIAFHLLPAERKIFKFPRLQRGSYNYSQTAVSNARRLLRIFGHLLCEIDFGCHLYPAAHKTNDAILEYIVGYCSRGNLQTLRINKIKLSAKQISGSASLFRNLKALHLMDLDNDSGSNITALLLPVCTNVQQLSAINCLLKKQHLLHCFPNLTELRLEFTTRTVALTAAVEQFIQRHKSTIKKLKLCKVDDFNLAIVEEMAALEELDYNNYLPKYVQSGNPASNLVHLNHLHTLSINIHTVAVSLFLIKLAATTTMANSLKRLLCNGCNISPLTVAKCLNKFRNLELLKIDETEDIAEMLQQLDDSICTSITQLDVAFSLLANDEDAAAMVVAISRFRNLRSLKVIKRIFESEGCDWTLLRKLERLAEFYFNGDPHDNGIDWLTNLLGSADTMRIIDVDVGLFCNVTGAYMQALNRFRNLRILNILCRAIDDDILNALDGLDDLTELDLRNGKAVTFGGILSLAKRLPKLEKISFYFAPLAGWLSFDIYTDLVDVYRKREKQLIIGIGEFNFLIPENVAAVYADFRRYVQFQMN